MQWWDCSVLYVNIKITPQVFFSEKRGKAYLLCYPHVHWGVETALANTEASAKASVCSHPAQQPGGPSHSSPVRRSATYGPSYVHL